MGKYVGVSDKVGDYVVAVEAALEELKKATAWKPFPAEKPTVPGQYITYSSSCGTEKRGKTVNWWLPAPCPNEEQWINYEITHFMELPTDPEGNDGVD